MLARIGMAAAVEAALECHALGFGGFDWGTFGGDLAAVELVTQVCDFDGLDGARLCGLAIAIQHLGDSRGG
jgi:hypothetical protein